MAKKRLVLVLDGTWNDLDDNTNVWRLGQLIAARGDDGLEQRVYYSRGVGNIFGQRFIGGALGYGLSREVVAAYHWLMGNFDPGDEIFLFGFSRGAFTARSLAGIVKRCGLLWPGSPLSVNELYARYRSGGGARPIYDLYGRGKLNIEEERVRRHSRRVYIKMIGVWDTVGALGVPFGDIPGLSRRRFRFHDTNLSALFRNAFHALAVDEHRAAFEPTLWTRFIPAVPDEPGRRRMPLTNVEQRWFAGAHANVGGGIAGDDMSQLPLAWLMEKAGGLGLAYRGALRLKGKEHLGPIHDSSADFLYGFYALAKLGRRFHRMIAPPPKPVTNGTAVTVNETIDGSIFDRWRDDPLYRPPSIARWAAERGRDPAALRGTIDARTGEAPVAPAPKARTGRKAPVKSKGA